MSFCGWSPLCNDSTFQASQGRPEWWVKLETEPLACAFGVCWGASALCQAVEQGVEEMTAVLALTLQLEGRQSTQRKDWRELAEAICVLHSL